MTFASKALIGAAALVVAVPTVDFAHWYFCCLVLQKAGEPTWNPWGNTLSREVFPNLHRDGDYRGSYDPIGRDCIRGGRVYSTALVLLMQSTYHRHSQLTGAQ